MSFPHLETLHVAAALRLSEKPWTCPRLKHMRLVHDAHPGSDRRMSTGMQMFVHTHAEQLHTLCLDSASPGLDLYPGELYLSFLPQCTNLRTLLLQVTVVLFTLGTTPLWTLTSLHCVALLLEDPVLFPDFMVLWDGFHAHDRFLEIQQFLVIYPHGMHDSADLELIQDHCGHDGRLAFQCFSNYVA